MIIKNTYDQFFKKYKNIVIYQKNISGGVSNNQSYMIVLKKNGLRNDLMNFLFIMH